MNSDPVLRWMMFIATGLLVLVLALNVWATAKSVDFGSVNTRLERIDNTLKFNSCLLLITPEERNEQAITACQAE